MRIGDDKEWVEPFHRPEMGKEVLMRFRDFVIATCFFVIAASLLAAVSLGVPLSNRQKLAIDHTTLDAIEIGMTQAEVEARIGGPPGDYTSGRFGVMRFT
jgi:hypothetical protein